MHLRESKLAGKFVFTNTDKEQFELDGVMHLLECDYGSDIHFWFGVAHMADIGSIRGIISGTPYVIVKLEDGREGTAYYGGEPDEPDSMQFIGLPKLRRPSNQGAPPGDPPSANKRM